MVSGLLAPNQQASGLALWNSVSNMGGYVGPAAFGHIKARTGSNHAAMLVRGWSGRGWVAVRRSDRELRAGFRAVLDGERADGVGGGRLAKAIAREGRCQ